MLLSLLLLAVAGASVSDRDANAAVMFIQSASTPALFEACKTVRPEDAVEYDSTLSRWKKKNKRVVEQGERVVRQHAKRDGTDVDAMLLFESEAMVSELRALSASEQRDRCDHLVDVLRNES